MKGRPTLLGEPEEIRLGRREQVPARRLLLLGLVDGRRSQRLSGRMIRKLKVPANRQIAERLVIRLITPLDQLPAQIAILFRAPGIDGDIFVCCLGWCPAFGEDWIEAEEGHGVCLAVKGREGEDEGGRKVNLIGGACASALI